MEDGVARRAVAIARAQRIPPAARRGGTVAIGGEAFQSAVIDTVGETLLRPDGLAVEVGATPGIVAGEPLMAVQVEDVRLLAGMEIPEDDLVVQIRVMDVGGIVREGFEQRRIAVGPALEEKLLVEALRAIGRRADA